MNPTFDEWFASKYGKGQTWEQLHCAPTMRMDVAMLSLSRYLREYVSEMVRGA